ncbi:NDMA-dependent alcohol dehydrogenase [Frankia sp. CN6]|uniref:NDMA-dependent alcohol dehydrogenase n=1 Tax=Frankia nepalensis TaxID=1836974 RepID=A0A937RJ94_9ACTN|nr:NDMA-dependent alcohol dehydrogenase [Frankia nepalensis]
MTTRAAVCRGPQQWWDVVDLRLESPRAHEVRIKFMAAGLCRSDEHVRTGLTPVRYPIVGGHEGAGIVESVGPGVTRVAPGDDVVCSSLPVCGRCHYCSTGHQNLCDDGPDTRTGHLPDGSFRFHDGTEDVGALCGLGTFSRYAVVPETSCIRLGEDIPFEVAALIGCGVPTGWGSSVYCAGVSAGDTVVIFGAGGVGSNAVQGARQAGARHVVVVDPVAFKREKALTFGATHVFETAGNARTAVLRMTQGRGADHAIVVVGVLDEQVLNQATSIVGKLGQVTITSGGSRDHLLGVNTGALVGYQQCLQGVRFGGCNPLRDIPRLLDLYRGGELMVDELITTRYGLDDINQGYRDLLEGKNIRGVVIHEH